MTTIASQQLIQLGTAAGRPIRVGRHIHPVVVPVVVVYTLKPAVAGQDIGAKVAVGKDIRVSHPSIEDQQIAIGQDLHDDKVGRAVLDRDLLWCEEPGSAGAVVEEAMF